MRSATSSRSGWPGSSLASRAFTFTRLEEDGVFAGLEDDDPSYFLALSPVDQGDLAQGITAAITVGVDPDAVNEGLGGPDDGAPPRH